MISGPIPQDHRQTLPDDVADHLPVSDDHSVDDYVRAVKLYCAGHSCADCEVHTGVNAEVLRALLQDLNLIRSASEAQRVRYLVRRERVRRLFEKKYRTMSIVRLTGFCRGTIAQYRRQWNDNVPLHEWST